MCLLQVQHALKENDKSCSTVSLEWDMLQASSKWSLKYLKVVQSFKNLNAKARWLTSMEDKSCLQIVSSGLCQGIFSGIFLKMRINYLFFFTCFAQIGILCGLFVSIHSRVQHRVHILWCPHSAGAAVPANQAFTPGANHPRVTPSNSQSHLRVLGWVLFFFFYPCGLKH